MAVHTNTDVHARTWDHYCREDGRTLRLEPGESTQVYRWVTEDDGAVTLVATTAIDDPYLQPTKPPRSPKPSTGATPPSTEAAPTSAESPKE